MWQEFIQQLDPDATTFPPAREADVYFTERGLHQTFPPSLRSLLLETNGIQLSNDLWAIWRLDRIEKINQDLRHHKDPPHMPVDHLLFFAEAINGDYLAFPIVNQRTRESVFRWERENDSRRWLAPTLKDYLKLIFVLFR